MQCFNKAMDHHKTPEQLPILFEISNVIKILLEGKNKSVFHIRTAIIWCFVDGGKKCCFRQIC